MIQRKDILVSLTQLLVLLVLSTVIVATAGDEAFGNGLNEVYGIVNANGYITRGTGFTVENPYAGYYFIRFNTPYVDDDAPVCVITALSIDPLVSCTGGASPTGMDVYCNEYSLVLDPKQDTMNLGHSRLENCRFRSYAYTDNRGYIARKRCSKGWGSLPSFPNASRIAQAGGSRKTRPALVHQVGLHV